MGILTTVFPQSDTIAASFSLFDFVWLLFKGGCFFEKLADISYYGTYW